jgi:hypothetical protein
MMRRMAFEPWSAPASSLAHMTGRAAIPAVTLFLAGIAAALGACSTSGCQRAGDPSLSRSIIAEAPAWKTAVYRGARACRGEGPA